MTVELTPELEQFIRDQVRSGAFSNETEVVRSALEAFRDQEILTPEDIAELRSALQPAIDSLDRGEGLEWDVEVMKARLKKRLESGDARHAITGRGRRH